jgi:hypothetical protein
MAKPTKDTYAMRWSGRVSIFPPKEIAAIIARIERQVANGKVTYIKADTA